MQVVVDIYYANLDLEFSKKSMHHMEKKKKHHLFPDLAFLKLYEIIGSLMRNN